MIQEVIVTTIHKDGSAHIAPMGIRQQDNQIVIAPFKPSATLENLKREGHATVNMTDDVRIFAGCLTNRRDWPVTDTEHYRGLRLANVLAYIELEVERMEDDELRPRFFCKKLLERNQAPFPGFNRAQAAVLEAAILVSRLDMLAQDKVDQEIEYLQIAMEKTAGEHEKTAWGWLMDKISEHRSNKQESSIA